MINISKKLKGGIFLKEKTEHNNLYIEKDILTKDKSKHRNYTNDIALTIGFLLGVKENQILNHVKNAAEYTVIKEKLEKNEDCIVIRQLNNIRSNLMLNYEDVSKKISEDRIPLDKIKLFEEDFKLLKSQGVNIGSNNIGINEYLANVNDEIYKRMYKIKAFFPKWVMFKNIQRLFLMPTNIEKESKRFKSKKSYYPYQRYFYWRDPKRCGYILCNDKYILEIAYSNCGKVFKDYHKIADASEATKNHIYDFIKDGDNIQIFIDGENADPYLFASVINSLSDCKIEKINKIVVCYDEVHTTKAWEYFKKFVSNIEVKTIPVQRVSDEKSLVDGKLMTAVNRAVYEENVDSIILVSSDSDFWSLIDDLKNVKFMVMVEKQKFGYKFKNKLREHNILYCYMDCFKTMEDNIFLKDVFRGELEETISGITNLGNAKTLFKDVLKRSRAQVSLLEQEILFDKFIAGIKLVIADDGNFKYEIPA